ncbi:MAG: hypothetical protein ACTSX7_17865 [Alphaproteobacteria bacterium]
MHQPTHTRTYQRLVEGTTINSTTLLATDYLNHFNEMVMYLDMLVDMPEMLDEARAWQPMSYQEHFLNSVFPERDLAVWAFEQAPAEFRGPFDELVVAMDIQISLSLEQVEESVKSGEKQLMRIVVELASRELQSLISKASAVINGLVLTAELKSGGDESEAATMKQSDIDSLFD